MISGFFSKKEKVYCQICGKDITKSGGFVFRNKGISCYGRKMTCPSKASEKYGDVYVEYKNPKEVQEDIKNKNLIYFGSLEKSAYKQTDG